jgi:aminoglycoside phosphotransferase (APT) family kinase protein
MSSDRHLDEAVAARVLAQQFPELAGAAVTPLGAGWDHDVFLCEGLVFRFPKRMDQVAWLARETEVLRLARAVLGSIVPDFSYVGEPTSDFPYPFVGYPLVPGIPADAHLPDHGALASDLGAALTRLHNVDAGLVPPTPTGEEPLAAAGHRLDLSSCARAVRERLPTALRAAADPYLLGGLPLPRLVGGRVFAHNDICAEHVLVDAASGRLTGLIDWTDAMVTDPAVDFVGLITISDWSFVRAVRKAYRRPLDHTFAQRLTWLTRTMTLRWLGEAIEEGMDGSRHFAWVQRAFADKS